MTQSALAQATGFSLRAIQNWESGRENLPRPTALRSLCAVLRVSSEWLIGDILDGLMTESIPDNAEGAGGVNVPVWMSELVSRLSKLDPIQRARTVPILLSIVDAISAAGVSLSECEDGGGPTGSLVQARPQVEGPQPRRPGDKASSIQDTSSAAHAALVGARPQSRPPGERGRAGKVDAPSANAPAPDATPLPGSAQ